MSDSLNPRQTILCLCREKHHWKLIPGYAAAFRARGIEFVYPDESIPLDTRLDAILRTLPARPSAIFHFESVWPLLPQGLERSEIPTVRFDADTYFYPLKRIRWSLLFDHVAVFHPGYEQMFLRAGHPGAFLLPHAVRRDFYEGPETEREFEVGWVGQMGGPLYRNREEWLPKLFQKFHGNDARRSYTVAEVAEVYRRSRIVVNIGRDDFPQDANLRVFEVLASGALLITSIPNELMAMGFQEGVHFIGYREEDEILPLVKTYLECDGERIRISHAGRTKVLNEHTYDNRVESLLERLNKSTPEMLAPAREWPEYRARLAYLDYFASLGLLSTAGSQFRHIAGRGPRETVEGALLLGKAWGRSLLSRTRV
jgi:Glycosyl transferases group 1